VLALTAAGVVAGSCALLALAFDRPNWKTLAAARVGPQAATLFMGSSTFYFGIDPRLYPGEPVNLSANYLDFASMERLWARHGAALANVRVAVLELNLCTVLFDTAATEWKSLRDLGLAATPGWRDVATDLDGTLRRVLWPLFQWRLTPRFLDEYEFRTGSTAEPQAAVAGHLPSTVELAAPELFAEREIAKGRRQLEALGERRWTPNLQAAGRLLAAFARRGIKVVLMRMPQDATLRSMFPAEWTARLEAAHAAVAASGAVAAYWDLTAEPGFVQEDFRDPDHLNTAGSVELAARLAPRLAALSP
jgi:hypothetical protein